MLLSGHSVFKANRINTIKMKRIDEENIPSFQSVPKPNLLPAQYFVTCIPYGCRRLNPHLAAKTVVPAHLCLPCLCGPCLCTFLHPVTPGRQHSVFRDAAAAPSTNISPALAFLSMQSPFKPWVVSATKRQPSQAGVPSGLCWKLVFSKYVENRRPGLDAGLLRSGLFWCRQAMCS